MRARVAAMLSAMLRAMSWLGVMVLLWCMK
jgi:hypothetical protein